MYCLNWLLLNFQNQLTFCGALRGKAVENLFRLRKDLESNQHPRQVSSANYQVGSSKVPYRASCSKTDHRGSAKEHNFDCFVFSYCFLSRVLYYWFWILLCWWSHEAGNVNDITDYLAPLVVRLTKSQGVFQSSSALRFWYDQWTFCCKQVVSLLLLH